MNGSFQIHRLIARLRRARRDTGGNAAVEFALVLPVLVMVYLGGFEISQLVSTYRKVCDATSQLADIASQTPSPTVKSALQSEMTAATQIMSPSPTANLKLIISRIDTDSSKAATVKWSQGWNGGVAYANGSSWTLPAALDTASQSYLLVQSQYNYSASFGASYIGATIPLANQVYIPARNIASLDCTDC